MYRFESIQPGVVEYKGYIIVETSCDGHPMYKVYFEVDDIGTGRVLYKSPYIGNCVQAIDAESFNEV